MISRFPSSSKGHVWASLHIQGPHSTINEVRMTKLFWQTAAFASRSASSYTPKARDSSAIRQRMQEIAQTPIHYDCERVQVMLRRQGLQDNHKRVHRIYKEEGLSLLHCRARRRRGSRRRQLIKIATAPNTCLGMDFVNQVAGRATQPTHHPDLVLPAPLAESRA